MSYAVLLCIYSPNVLLANSIDQKIQLGTSVAFFSRHFSWMWLTGCTGSPTEAGLLFLGKQGLSMHESMQVLIGIPVKTSARIRIAFLNEQKPGLEYPGMKLWWPCMPLPMGAREYASFHSTNADKSQVQEILRPRTRS